MKYYLITAFLIITTIVVATFLPLVAARAESSLVDVQIQVPKISSDVAGTFKYNLPPLDHNIPIASFSARAIVVKDLGTDTVLYQKNADVSVPIASTTKIMTAIIASSFFKPNSPIYISSASAQVGGSEVGFVPGEILDFHSVLYGMLLNSGNDAAYALAENYPGGVSAFVNAMNEEAVKLNLHNTHFDNPIGFDSPFHYSSASDLAIITEEALKNPTLAQIVDTKTAVITSLDNKFTHSLSNLNELLTTVPGVIGVKTGYTEGAKENLVTLVDRAGHRILTVLLGSDDRFGESTTLINWAYSNFTWQ